MLLITVTNKFLDILGYFIIYKYFDYKIYSNNIEVFKYNL